MPFVAKSYPIKHEIICKQLNKTSIDIISFQEVFTYRDLLLLRRNLSSYPYIGYAPSLVGPKGAMVTFSKIPIGTVNYASFLKPTKDAAGSKISMMLLKSCLKGILFVHVPKKSLIIINTHPLSNKDGDWSNTNRFYDIHKAQLSALAFYKHQLSKVDYNIILNGDLNVPQDSKLFKDFLKQSKLYDVFVDDRKPTVKLPF